MKLEAPPGFEPGVEVLQTSALPLGDGADRTEGRDFGPTGPRYSEQRAWCSRSGSDSRAASGRPPSLHRSYGGQLSPAFVSESWSGKRDSNPRLRPWQGRTLPLSYSRSPNSKRNTLPVLGSRCWVLGGVRGSWFEEPFLVPKQFWVPGLGPVHKAQNPERHSEPSTQNSTQNPEPST
jgi:hypothetical protein